MPSRPPTAGLLKHVLYLTNAYTDSDMLTFWTYKAGSPSGARITYERGAILAWVSAQWAPHTTYNISASRLVTWDMEPATPVAVARSLIWPSVPGSLAATGGQFVPRGVCAVIALRSQPVGSAIRDRLNGRLYHPGLTVSTGTPYRVNGDYLDAPLQTQLAGAYDDLVSRLKTSLHADSGNWSIVSWRTAAGFRVSPVIVPIDHTIARPQVGFQRRKEPRVGPYARGA